MKRLKKKTKNRIGAVLGVIAVFILGGISVTDILPEVFNGVMQEAENTFKEPVEDIKTVADTFTKAKDEIASEVKKEVTADNYDAVGTVVRVVDGDTYLLNIDGEEVKVRLIGVDTPESVAPDTYRTENTEEGKDISEIVKDKITEGMTLYIEYDVSPTDRYGRHLAYLYFENGVMVQEWLLTNGYANIATYPPNVKYVEHFTELAHKAAEDKIGLWNGFFEESK